MSTNNDHPNALMCDSEALHAANRDGIFFYDVESGEYLDDALEVIAIDPTQEAYVASPKSSAGLASPTGATPEAPARQPKVVQNNKLQLAGLPNAVPNAVTGIKGMQLLSLSPSSPSQNGAGPTPARKTSARPKAVVNNDDNEKYGRVLPGPWDQSHCPNSRLHPGPNGCPGLMHAFYTLEFEEGNSYMYRCDTCSVISSISFRESKIKFND
jgi:hypothetical protein